MGRKPLKPKNLRSELITIRVTKAEHATLKAKAEKAGFKDKLGTWLRTLGLSH